MTFGSHLGRTVDQVHMALRSAAWTRRPIPSLQGHMHGLGGHIFWGDALGCLGPGDGELAFKQELGTPDRQKHLGFELFRIQVSTAPLVRPT